VLSYRHVVACIHACYYNTIQYKLLNSSNKRACSNRFVNFTVVSSN